MRILIIDDEKTIRKALSFALQKKSHETTEAANPIEALKRTDLHRFDLIILDLDMPILTGLDFVKILEERGKDIPIVFLTAQNRSMIQSLGFRDYCGYVISKDLSMPDILRKIESYIRQIYTKQRR